MQFAQAPINARFAPICHFRCPRSVVLVRVVGLRTASLTSTGTHSIFRIDVLFTRITLTNSVSSPVNIYCCVQSVETRLIELAYLFLTILLLSLQLASVRFGHRTLQTSIENEEELHHLLACLHSLFYNGKLSVTAEDFVGSGFFWKKQYLKFILYSCVCTSRNLRKRELGATLKILLHNEIIDIL